MKVLITNSRTLRGTSAAVALDTLNSPSNWAEGPRAPPYSPMDRTPVAHVPKPVAMSRRQNRPPLGGCKRPDPASERVGRVNTARLPRPPEGDRTRRRDHGSRYRFVPGRASRQVQTLAPRQGVPLPPRVHSGSIDPTSALATASSGAASERISMRQPVSRAANRAFCPSRPMASES